MSVLLGHNIHAGLNAAELGLKFVRIPAGHYPIGAEPSYELRHRSTLPPQLITTPPFEISTTTVTNHIFAQGLQRLEGKTSVLMGHLPNGTVKLFARGTREEIANMSTDDMNRAVGETVTASNFLSIPAAFSVFVTFNKVLRPRDPVSLIHRLDEMSGGFSGPQKPVSCVSKKEARVWSMLFGCDIPDEVSWEIAARGPNGNDFATSTGEIFDGDKKLAHFAVKGADPHTMDVASFPPNWIGAYDMVGNVSEWTSSVFDGSDAYGHAGDEVVRGSGWCFNKPEQLLAIIRRGYGAVNHFIPQGRSTDIGFRCFRPLSPT